MNELVQGIWQGVIQAEKSLEQLRLSTIGAKRIGHVAHCGIRCGVIGQVIEPQRALENEKRDRGDRQKQHCQDYPVFFFHLDQQDTKGGMSANDYHQLIEAAPKSSAPGRRSRSQSAHSLPNASDAGGVVAILSQPDQGFAGRK